MLAATILSGLVWLGLILLGLGMTLMAFLAEANSPIPGQVKAGGFAIAGMVLAAASAALLALTVWGY